MMGSYTPRPAPAIPSAKTPEDVGVLILRKDYIDGVAVSCRTALSDGLTSVVIIRTANGTTKLRCKDAATARDYMDAIYEELCERPGFHLRINYTADDIIGITSE